MLIALPLMQILEKLQYKTYLVKVYSHSAFLNEFNPMYLIEAINQETAMKKALTNSVVEYPEHPNLGIFSIQEIIIGIE